MQHCTTLNKQRVLLINAWNHWDDHENVSNVVAPERSRGGVVYMRLPAWYRFIDSTRFSAVSSFFPPFDNNMTAILTWRIKGKLAIACVRQHVCLCFLYLHLTSLKCVLIYSRLLWCSSVQPISSAKRAMPMTLAGSRCLVRKSQHALATSSIWYLVENNTKQGQKKHYCLYTFHLKV